MSPPGAVPVGDRSGTESILDDLTPTHPGVVGAERDLPELGAIGDDAHLGSAEIVIPQVLKPHPGNEQKSPRKFRSISFAGSYSATAGTDLADQLFDQLRKTIALRGTVWTKVAQDRNYQGSHRQLVSELRVRDRLDVTEEAVDIENLWQRYHLLGVLVDQQDGSNPTIRVTTALERSEFFADASEQIHHVAKRVHGAQRKPIP